MLLSAVLQGFSTLLLKNYFNSPRSTLLVCEKDRYSRKFTIMKVGQKAIAPTRGRGSVMVCSNRHRISGKERAKMLGVTLTFGIFCGWTVPSHADVVRIGSPSEWSQYESYWQRLIDSANSSRQPSDFNPRGSNPLSPHRLESLAEEQKIIRNLRISGLKLLPFRWYSRTTQVVGKITNWNNQPVTVTGINFEIRDVWGNLIQTNAAIPEPETIPPGTTVTFQRRLLLLPRVGGYEVRLMRSNPLTIRNRV